jgi:hypothetical protein
LVFISSIFIFFISNGLQILRSESRVEKTAL